MNCLKKYRRKITRFIFLRCRYLPRNSDKPYHNYLYRLKILNLELLSFRMLKIDLITFYKIKMVHLIIDTNILPTSQSIYFALHNCPLALEGPSRF